MFSSLRFFLIGFVFVVISGCAKLGFLEKIPEPAPVVVRNSETACLNQAGKVIEDYLQSRIERSELDSMFQCVDNSIQLFIEKTRTSTPGVYHPIELRNFIEKFFIRERIISNSLLLETMEFKKSVLGGRGDILTSDELRSAQRIISSLRKQLIRLEPYRPLSVLKLSSISSVEQNEVLKVFSEIASDFGFEIASTAGDYSMSRFESLIREYEKVFPSENLKSFLRRFSLVREMKPVLFGTSSEEFGSEEWPRLLKTAARVFGIYLKVQPIYPDETGKFPVLTCGSGLERLREAGLELLQMIDESIDYHGSLQMVPLTDLIRVVDALDVNDLPGIRRTSLKRFLRPIVQRYLAGQTEGVLGREAEGITKLSVSRARSLFLDWFDGQRLIEGVFTHLGSFDCQASPELKPSYSLKELESVSIETALGVDRLEQLDPRTAIAAQRLVKNLKNSTPLYSSVGPKVVLDPTKGRSKYFYNDLLQLNLLSVGSVMVTQGYREKKFDDIREKGEDSDAVVVDEIIAFYNDFREIGIDIQLVDPTEWDAARDRFRDANLFMPSSNGDMRLMSVSESLELMGVLGSSKTISNQLYDELLKNCKSIPGGIFGTRLIELACFREGLTNRFSDFYSNLPALIQYLQGLDSKSRNEFFDIVFEIAKANGKNVDYVEISDSDRLSTVLHYLELVYMSFDEDYSLYLNTKESLKAFDRFEQVLTKITKQQDFEKATLRALFTYILSRGKLPGTTLEKASFLWWKTRGPKNWSLSVDRINILRVFAMLAASGSTQITREDLAQSISSP